MSRLSGMPTRSKVCRWGNSPAIRIPATVSREIQIEDGDAVELHVQDGRFVVTPIRRRYTLDELVAGITDENRHEETEWGAAVGKEAW